MKLEVGMYVRTKYGIIEKIEDILEFEGDEYYLNSFHTAVKVDRETDVAGSKGRITKASFDIRDLIKVGDYVNDEKVTEVENGWLAFGDYDYYITDTKDIKSIVTKEQFESMKYEVK